MKQKIRFRMRYHLIRGMEIAPERCPRGIRGLDEWFIRTGMDHWPIVGRRVE